MTLALKDLGTGQLPSSKGTLYTCGVTGAAGRINLVNTGASARTINIYVNKSGTSRRISPKDMTLGVGERWNSVVETFENGDLLEGDASAANEVDYSISGFEIA